MNGIAEQIMAEVNRAGLEDAILKAITHFKKQDFFMLQARFNANKNSFFNNEIDKGEYSREDQNIQRSLFFFINKQDPNLLPGYLGLLKNEEINIPQPLQGIKKIQFIAASPIDMNSQQAVDPDKLQFDMEFRKITDAVKKGKNRDKFSFLTPALAADFKAFLKICSVEKPYLIHFAGHGAEDGIYLSNDKNRWQLVPNQMLDEVFNDSKEYIRCVVMNSCYSAAQAEIISNHIEYVVGNNVPVKDRHAIYFADLFYEFMAEEESIEKAFGNALRVIKVETSITDLPVLWKNGNPVASN